MYLKSGPCILASKVLREEIQMVVSLAVKQL